MLASDELASRARKARKLLVRCRLCPRACCVDRPAGEHGFCGAGSTLRVAACAVHFGEEPPISGTRGSGNIFFTGCNLACLYCQNYPISRFGVGRDMAVEELAGTLLALQSRGVHNVNLVSPTVWVPQILETLALAAARGFRLPVVYNTGGYDSLETLQLLEGVVDIYLPDMKYACDREAYRYSRAPRYVGSNRRAIAEMHRQVGALATDDAGIGRRGVLVRHLVLPEGQAGTGAVLRSLRRISPDLPLSIMYQYFPAHRAIGHSVIGRKLWKEECDSAGRLVAELGVSEGWAQDYA